MAWDVSKEEGSSESMALSTITTVFYVCMILFIVLVAQVADAKFMSYGETMSNRQVCGVIAGCSDPGTGKL